MNISIKVFINGEPFDEMSREKQYKVIENIMSNSLTNLEVTGQTENVNNENYEMIESAGAECYAPKDIAKILSISQAESYRVFKTKDFPSFKLGERMLRVTKKDFAEWLNKKIDKNSRL